MDRSLNESRSQSDIEDIEESVLQESLTDDKDSANDSACSTLEETFINESESRKDSQTLDYNEETSSRDVSEEEIELKDPEVRELCKDIGNSQRLSMEAKFLKQSKDKKHSSPSSSTIVNAELESFSTENVVEVPAQQASISSIATCTTTSGSQTKRSEPLAIPSTSKDSSGLAPASESSPKRPTNFGRKAKQAIHVFHPTGPKSILRKVPIPIHSGRWVYLRDSPESSDYGGSPDSLDDPFLMEALYGKTPESEKEDMFTPRNEEMPSCPPPIQNPVLDSDSPVDEVTKIVGGLQCAPGHSKRTFGDTPSDHTKQNIEDYSYEPGPTEGIVEDKPLDIEDLSSTNDHTERTVERLFSDLGSMKMTLEDLSESVNTELKAESRYSSRARENVFNESGRNSEGTGDQLFESVRMQRTSKDLHPESNYIQINITDNPSESVFTEENTEENLSEDLTSEFSNIESNAVIEYQRRESSHVIEVHSYEECDVERFDDTHLELNEANSSPEKQNNDVSEPEK